MSLTLGLLDLSTDIWKDQINFLDNFSGKAKFAWMLNHDTSNAIKMELRKKGHFLMVNKPLYKAKMIHNDSYSGNWHQAVRMLQEDGGMHECLGIDSTHFLIPPILILPALKNQIQLKWVISILQAHFISEMNKKNEKRSHANHSVKHLSA